MIYVNRYISIDPREIKLQFIRSPGPGGQNVNKVSTAVLLRYDVKNTSSLPDEVKTRLMGLAGKHISSEGILSLKSHSFRTQERNRNAALNRLVRLIQEAAQKPKLRLKTKLSRNKKAIRLESKRRRSTLKQARRRVNGNEI